MEHIQLQVPASASASSSSSIISSSPSSPTWILCYRRSEFCFNISQAVCNHPRAVCWQLCRNDAFFSNRGNFGKFMSCAAMLQTLQAPQKFPFRSCHSVHKHSLMQKHRNLLWVPETQLRNKQALTSWLFSNTIQSLSFSFANIYVQTGSAFLICRKTEFYDSEAGPTVRCYLRMATNFSARSLTREPSPQSATQAAGISSSVPMEPKHAPAMDARLAVQPPTLMLASTAST